MSRDWRVSGPKKRLLTAEEVVAELGLSDKQALRRLIDAGRFPPGFPLGKKHNWLALDVACYLHLLSRMGTAAAIATASSTSKPAGKAAGQSGKANATNTPAMPSGEPRNDGCDEDEDENVDS